MSENEDTLKYHLCCWEYEFSDTPCSGSENAHQQKSKKSLAVSQMMCIYIYTVIPNHIPETSGPQQLKLIRFQIYRDIPFTHHNVVYDVFIIRH
jgi:hypothetical protein